MNRWPFFCFLMPAFSAALSTASVETASAHGMGNHVSTGMHSFDRGFARSHQGFTVRHHGDRFFRRRRFFFGLGFDAFGFPWWYLDDGWYPYAYSYYDDGSSYSRQYWSEMAESVQFALARRGFYHGPLNGSIDSNSRNAIREFQATQQMPVTGMIDPKLLKALKIDFTDQSKGAP